MLFNNQQSIVRAIGRNLSKLSKSPQTTDDSAPRAPVGRSRTMLKQIVSAGIANIDAVQAMIKHVAAAIEQGRQR